MKKLQKMVREFKEIANTMKVKAAHYKSLDHQVRNYPVSKAVFADYQNTWRELCKLNDRANSIEREYKTACSTLTFRVLSALGIVKKQGGFHWLDGDKCRYNPAQLINIVLR